MKKYLSLAGIVMLLITACSPSLQVEYADPDTYIYTQSALTIEAMVTQSALTEIPPTQTPAPVLTDAITQTPIPSVTATALPASTSIKTIQCDWVAFIKDVTIPDKTVWIQGTHLTKTWRLKNRGSCTWTPDYSLVFSHGAQMGAPSAVKLPSYVQPGETVDVSVNLTVPEATGHYVGYWMLKNPSGVIFGYGERADKPFYIDLHSEDRRSGSVTGKLEYPSEFIPPLRVVAFNQNHGTYFWVDTAQNQQYYEIKGLTPGDYTVVAYYRGTDMTGGYTTFVVCGFAPGCNNHSLNIVHIDAGTNAVNINPNDWYAPVGAFPPDPTGPAVTPTPHMDIPPLTLTGLKNAEYRVIVNGTVQSIRMINGQYQIGTDPASPGFMTVTVNDLAAFGDLNGDRVDDAIIILSEWYGGTGIDVYVAAFTNWAGIPLHKASVLIDDRAIIQSIRVENGSIIVKALVHGVNDPGCCPSQQVTRIFRLVDQSLVEQ